MNDDRANEIQLTILRRMSGAQRLRLACEMSDTARGLCRARIRQQHPAWTEAEVTREMVRSAFMPQPCPW